VSDESHERAAMTTWNTTRVGGERRAGLVNGLPIIRDDTKLAQRPEDVAQYLYDITAGRTRDRGSPRGLDRTTAFSTILILSGESRAVSMSGDGGTRARVLTLWGGPFGSANQGTAQLVTALNLGIKQHYGHAGPQLVRYLLQHRQRWDELRARYEAIRACYQARAQGSPVVGRLADALAILSIAGELAAEALDMPRLRDSAVEELWAVLTDEAAEANRATQALAFIYDWACANHTHFYDPADTSWDGKRVPATAGWAGHWSGSNSRASWGFLGFIPARLCELLKEGGYAPDAVISSWRDRGWLLVDPSDRAGRYHQVLIGGGHKPRVVAIKREAFAQEGCLREGSPLSHLQEVAQTFVHLARSGTPQPGSPTSLSAAIHAIVLWLSSLPHPLPAGAESQGGAAHSLAAEAGSDQRPF
jgi:hypothetical protein